LGMVDTGFSVPAEKRARLASCYKWNANADRLELHDGVDDSQWSGPPVFSDGAAGLVSTVDDVLRFGQALLGRLPKGARPFLSQDLVAAMTTDALTPEQRAGSEVFLGARGWGLGVAVSARRDGDRTGSGRFGWDGGFGTSWASDPERDR